MTKISELPNTPDYPLRDLAELRRKELRRHPIKSQELKAFFAWFCTPEGHDFWEAVDEGATPPIPAASIEDLRKAGMMPEPEPVIKDFARVDKPSFFCRDAEEIGVVKCKDQCAYCKDAEDTGSSIDTAPPRFLCKIRHYGTLCEKQCAECAVDAEYQTIITETKTKHK